jgi:hypothetical protein
MALAFQLSAAKNQLSKGDAMRLIGLTALILAVGLPVSANCQKAGPDKAAPADSPAKTSPSARFARLVGTWDVVYEIYNKDGNVRRYNGQAIYTVILNGSAVQEIWTSDAHNTQPQPYGTTIEFYDEKHQSWTAVWIYPAQGMTTVVTGSETDGNIVLTGRDQAGATERWSITEMQADSFLWRYEISDDDGKSWRLLGVNHMHRHHV